MDDHRNPNQRKLRTTFRRLGVNVSAPAYFNYPENTQRQQPPQVPSRRDRLVSFDAQNVGILAPVDGFLFSSRIGLLLAEHRSVFIRRPFRAVRTVTRGYLALGNYSLLNLLVLAVPIAVALGAHGNNHQIDTVFALNYVALLSLPGIFSFGCEVLSASIAQQGGISPNYLWTAIFSIFSLDLEVAVVALCRGYTNTVHGYIIGKIVAKCLLTLGICFLVGGLRRSEQAFNVTSSQASLSLLVTAAIPLAVLLCFPQQHDEAIEECSRAASFVLLPIYGLYLLFKFRTHRALCDTELNEDEQWAEGETTEASEIHSLGLSLSIIMLISAPVLAFFCSTYLFDALESSPTRTVSFDFLGFCMIPLLAEAAELSKVLWIAYTDHMDFVMVLTADIGVQTALFIAPAMTLLAWALGKSLSLRFEQIYTVALFVSIWIFGLQVSAGKSNYLSGAQCIALYIVLTLAVFLH